MEENRRHWYDGLFYDLFIAPYQDKIFAQVKEIVNGGSVVLDVGCGTGRLASLLLDKCDKIEIIDSSEENIGIARHKLAAVRTERLAIVHTDFLEFITKNYSHFDFAVVSYVIHQIREEERDVLLWGLSAVADKVIILDYLVPQPRNYCGFLYHLVEYAAGPLHYRNFKSFVKGNGFAGLLERVPLNILSEVRDQPCSSHFAVLEGKKGWDGKTCAHNPVLEMTRARVRNVG